MTPFEIRSLLSAIGYKPGFEIALKKHEGAERWYLQVTGMVPFPQTRWNGRKWDVSEHMTRSEIVLTCFKAFLTFEEHECREAFTFHGQKVCGPHINLDEVAKLLELGVLNTSERT